MINIFYIDYYADNSPNGVTSYTNQYLASVGCNTEISLNCIWLKSSNTNAIKKKTSKGINHFYLPNKTGDLTLNVNEWLANMIFQIISKEEEPIIHFNWISHAEIFKYLRWRLQFKLVLTKHCIPWRDLITKDYRQFAEINEYFEKGKTLPSLKKAILMETPCYKYVDHIITVTEHAKKSLTKLFAFDDEKSTVIYNGLNFNSTFGDLDIDKNQLRKIYGFNETDRLILFAGTISETKGVLDLIGSFELVLKEPGYENTRLIIAGAGDYSLIFKRKEILSKITLTGNLAKKILINFYKMADVGVIPSYAEQCSYTAIEMMQSNLPLIVSNVDGLKEIAQKDFALHVPLIKLDSGSVAIDRIELKNTIIYCFANSSVIKKKANLASENALIQFSLSTMSEKLFVVYKKVAAQPDFEYVFFNRSDLPKVSVLLPVYNGANYIEDCIQSVLNQTYKNWELIIVNDASDDNTLSIIKRFSDSRIKVVNNKVKRGITHCLNKGLTVCNGVYTARIDADDIMLPNRLYEQVYFLENNDDYGMIGSWYEVINKEGQHVRFVKGLQENEDIKFLLLFGNQFAHSTTMIKTEALKIYKYTSAYEHCEDYELWFRISQNFKIGNLPTVLCKYRIHGENVSRKYSVKQKSNSLHLIASQLNKLKPDITSNDIKIHAAIFNGLGVNYFSRGSNLFDLNKWLDSLLSLDSLNYTNEKKEEFKKFIFKAYCFRSSESNFIN